MAPRFWLMMFMVVGVLGTVRVSDGQAGEEHVPSTGAVKASVSIPVNHANCQS